ncbi:membrane protease subunit (stomatin/prohibitin family) [Dysgonomonas hofstadii]|uniref:Membrane protease subunit (Stomatin/prohibitin family) n=1 Tax=Dysgonomonas hofstadii TaxID=637886 RepID=A0A840CU56_9BACT|nr:membrane protease subunit (stomatin/prohibitin family) [Dysgonomonas hofstadii]
MNNWDEKLIAPCGINCGVCYVYLRSSKPCPGCNGLNENKPKHCVTCGISNCEKLVETGTRFCYNCEKFPCIRLRRMDVRYSQNYHISLIENLRNIQVNGSKIFMKAESIKWTCPHCNKIRSMHKTVCTTCNKKLV